MLQQLIELIELTVRDIDGVLYCNDGDWVESCTALVEDHDGRMSILRWADRRQRRALALAPARLAAE